MEINNDSEKSWTERREALVKMDLRIALYTTRFYENTPVGFMRATSYRNDRPVYSSDSAINLDNASVDGWDESQGKC